MSLRFSVLASGSTGNAIYVETDQQKILIDAGLSGKKIEGLLKKISCRPEDLDAILVSHEHSDHIQGVGIIARRYNLPIYGNEKTWKAMDAKIGPIDTEQKFHFECGETKSFADIDVESFGVSHDAADPMFFVFHHEGKKLALATDMGYVSDHIKGTIRNADAMIFESNHDMNMLQMGRYPWNIKRRILGDYGHVSNEDAAYGLSDAIGDHTTRVYLAHLSMDNNMKDLARMTVSQILKEKGVPVGYGLDLYDTDPQSPTALEVV